MLRFVVKYSYNNIQTDKVLLKNIGGIKIWQDVQHQFTVIARQVQEKTAQRVEVVIEVVMEVTTRILHHILHYQTVLQVVVVVADKLGQKHVGLQLVLLFYILLRKFEHLLLCVKMLRNVQNHQIYEMFFFVTLGMTVKTQLRNYTIYLNQKV
ncbi:hypothetical protein A3844_30095 [Paenibacillus helianthi]|uniref:Uncharacterized protein n=1 Tax=Paenibacillus helianthi TaxID=1349432 RepID=A0ABX3EE85_9BACL|nr:hypothetical protein A3844_30095 [Paenibacillus helianthi]OKP96257.1 hypothetical protein A3849_22060 [Paenibacillus sp. P46E]